MVFDERQICCHKKLLAKEIIDMAMDMWKTDEEFGNAYLKTEQKDITYKNHSIIDR